MLLGIVTGLAGEAACLAPAPDQRMVRCFGPGPQAASRAAGELLAAGCQALLSFGVAGGLHERLPSGQLVIASTVIDQQGELIATDVDWGARLSALMMPHRTVERGAIAGSDRALVSVEEKRALYQESGAVAVDMESHAVARAAARAGVPFVVARAVCDPASSAVPGWLTTVLDGAGRPRLGTIVARLAGRPADLLPLLALAGYQRLALVALRHVGRDAGPLFALV